jgi:hypothetical protein
MTSMCVCQQCGCSNGVELEDSRTNYVEPDYTFWDRLKGKDPEDPNAPIPLCQECAKEHKEYWDEMWANYYHDRI